MTKERELLRKIIRNMQYLHYSCNVKLRDEIIELLAQAAQPEQTESCVKFIEPETAMLKEKVFGQSETNQTPDYYLWHDEVHQEHPTTDGDPDVYPLYTSPQKLEPLSREDMHALFPQANSSVKWDYTVGFRLAEKAHGIGE